MIIKNIDEYNVRSHGAQGSSAADDYPALQAALDSGEPLVYVPYGKYRISSTLKIGSHTRLHLHPEAEIIFDDGAGRDAGSFLITNKPGATDIEITGGIWNGNRMSNPRVLGAMPEQLASGGAYLGIGLSFLDTDGLRLAGMTIRDTEAFHLRLHGVRDFLVEDITFDDLLPSMTQDGVHMGGGCGDGTVRHIRARGASSPNDDMIALIADLPYDGMMPEDPIYGQKTGDIRRIKIYDIKADDTFSFVRLMSDKYMVEDINIDDVAGGFYYLALQLQISPYLRRGKEDNSSGVFGVGHIRNVRVSNWDVYHRYRWGARPGDYEFTDCGGMIDIEQRIEGLVIENFRRDMGRDTLPGVPTLNYKSFTAAEIAFEAPEGTRIVASGGEHKAHAGERTLYEMNDTDRLALYGSITHAEIKAK